MNRWEDSFERGVWRTAGPGSNSLPTNHREGRPSLRESFIVSVATAEYARQESNQGVLRLAAGLSQEEDGHGRRNYHHPSSPQVAPAPTAATPQDDSGDHMEAHTGDSSDVRNVTLGILEQPTMPNEQRSRSRCYDMELSRLGLA